jgi:hypothetical protein
MAINADTIRDYLPYYLTEDAKAGILNELRKFPLGEMQYYLFNRYEQEILQVMAGRDCTCAIFTLARNYSSMV